MSTVDSLRCPCSPRPSENSTSKKGILNLAGINAPQSTNTLATETSTLCDESLSLRWQESGGEANSLEDGRNGENRVQFDTVHVREYGYTVSDNPSVKSGPALTIEWEHHFSKEMRLSMYEAQRQPKDGDDGVSSEGRIAAMPSNLRLKILRRSGVPQKEIRRAVKKSNIGRHQRRKSAQAAENPRLDQFHWKMEKLGDAIKDRLKLKRNDSEDEWWDWADAAQRQQG